MMRSPGMIGGLCYRSTIPIYQRVNEYVNEELGGLNSADLHLRSVNMQEYFDLMSAGKWDTVTDKIITESEHMKDAGSESISILTNTVNKVATDVDEAISIPVLHITDPLAQRISELDIEHYAILGSNITMRDGFYQREMQMRLGEGGKYQSKKDVYPHIPNDDDCDFLDSMIFGPLMKKSVEEIMATEEGREQHERFIDIIRGLHNNLGVQAVALACTEFPSFVQCEHLPDDVDVKLLNTTDLFADYIGQWAVQFVHWPPSAQTK